MNTKHFMIIAALILVAGLGANAAAQRKTNLEGSVNGPISVDTTVTLKLHAVEVTDGLIGVDPNKGETMFGYGFLGRTSGDLPGSFTFSMNCFPAVFVPGEANEITGGMWTFPVYMRPSKDEDTVYMGSFYGSLVDGKMRWDKVGNAEVHLVFNVDGSTQTWDSVTGYGFFEGTMTQDEKGSSRLDGELTIIYRR